MRCEPLALHSAFYPRAAASHRGPPARRPPARDPHRPRTSLAPHSGTVTCSGGLLVEQATAIIMDSSKEFPPMSLCRWQRFRSMLRGFQLIAVACGVAVLAVAVPRDARAQPSSGWGAFLGYTYQWAKVTPRANGLTLPVETSVSQPPSGINGWVASVERSLPLSTVSWVGEVRGAYAAWNFRVDAAQIHQDASQYLLLTGLRFGEKAGGVRPFIDGLAVWRG